MDGAAEVAEAAIIRTTAVEVAIVEIEVGIADEAVAVVIMEVGAVATMVIEESEVQKE